VLHIEAKINSVSYQPTMADELVSYDISKLDEALKHPCFKLRLNSNHEYALSQWVSPKRTRSYPFARVYHTLAYGGKRVTLIPVIKDEGSGGDRDYIQWDTIALMSLLQVHVILVYYVSAEVSEKKENKITNQQIDQGYLHNKLQQLSVYKSDALHWNMRQAESIVALFKQALDHYDQIADTLQIPIHCRKSAEKRIKQIEKAYLSFREESRKQAKLAQHRESRTIQPKEKLIQADKAIITIGNFLNGVYYLTADEARISGNDILLVEAKHTKSNRLPSKDDILDGCIKMHLFSNLSKVNVGDVSYNPQAVLKLTNADGIKPEDLSIGNRELLSMVIHEAESNGFMIELG